MISKRFIQYHRVNFSILLFIILFAGIHLLKPSLFYLPNGSYRQFGVGYRNKTILPIWICAILLAIFCYMTISYYLLVA